MANKSEMDPGSAPAPSARTPAHAEQWLGHGDDDCDATSIGTEPITTEKLLMIKARTMFEMVEDIPLSSGRSQRLLFLRNSQAELIGKDESSLQKMLDALEVPKPKLLINLCVSGGSSQHLSSCTDENWFRWKECLGWVKGRGAYLGEGTEDAAIDKLDAFMASTILPLAAQTNAVVICEACSNTCMLTASFTRVLALRRSTWGAQLPFSVLSCTSYLEDLYYTHDPSAHWRAVYRSSKAWQQRKPLIDDIFRDMYPDHKDVPKGGFDLDPNAEAYIIVDTIGQRRGKSHFQDKGPCNALLGELVRYLSHSLPSLSLKTGSSWKPSLQNLNISINGLSQPLNHLLAGTPVLFLDLRDRPDFSGEPDRESLISAAKGYYTKSCEEFLANGLAENMDAMSVAYFADVLFGDGNPHSDSMDERRRLGSLRTEPLHKAIERAQRGDMPTNDRHPKDLPAHSVVMECAAWLASKFFEDAWAIDRKRENETATVYYQDQIQAFRSQISTIWQQGNFHYVNINGEEGSMKRLVDQLVKLDKIPQRVGLQGLLLLKEAWCEVDVANYLANSYKQMAKFLFAMQLCIGWLLILTGVMDQIVQKPIEDQDVIHKYPSAHVLFGLALAVTVLTGVDKYFNSRARWIQLRGSACSLEATIWFYRCRIGRFQVSRHDDALPEKELNDAVATWRDDVIGGADLQKTDLDRERPAKVYKHYQRADSCLPQLQQDDDDHYSPVVPQQYIETRMKTMLKFYTKRIPVYARMRGCLQFLILIATTASAICAYLDLSHYVVAIAGFSSAVIGWSEFADVGSKIERYSRAIRELKKMSAWWDTLSDVERHGTDNIVHLIEGTEDIIADERLAWRSTSNRKPSDKRKMEQAIEAV